jgi:hypothetical protein
LTDHTGTITAMLELDNKLITCGIDKNIVVYDIKIKKGKLIKKKSEV